MLTAVSTLEMSNYIVVTFCPACFEGFRYETFKEVSIHPESPPQA